MSIDFSQAVKAPSLLVGWLCLTACGGGDVVPAADASSASRDSAALDADTDVQNTTSDASFRAVDWDAAPPCARTVCTETAICDATVCGMPGTYCQSIGPGFGEAVYSECTDAGWMNPDWCEFGPMSPQSPQGLPCGYPPATVQQSTCEHAVAGGVETYTCTDAGWQPAAGP